MGVIQLRPTGGGSERAALRLGAAGGVGPGARLRVLDTRRPGAAWCAGCAAPIEFGQVTRGGLSFCSIECSLGGGRLA